MTQPKSFGLHLSVEGFYIGFWGWDDEIAQGYSIRGKDNKYLPLLFATEEEASAARAFYLLHKGRDACDCRVQPVKRAPTHRIGPDGFERIAPPPLPLAFPAQKHDLQYIASQNGDSPPKQAHLRIG